MASKKPIKAVMRERYNVTSSGYDELYRNEQYEKYRLAMRLLEPRGKVLDDGCGTALLLEYLYTTGMLGGLLYYICLDLSPGMLRVARRRIASLNLGHLVECIEADAENIPLRSKSIDYTFSFTVVDLVEDKARALKEMDRVTKLYTIVTSLKKAHQFARKIPKYGLYAGETSKDYVFIRKSSQGLCRLIPHHGSRWSAYRALFTAPRQSPSLTSRYFLTALLTIS
ncbi:class I SAM-dependent methyltransferase [Pyrodictium occultum]|uniref:class I SAM-dependent methyltransferase n=1 Tax=Pyrodictium occultum TaxID=2309 RepID=UPI0009FB44BE|nr:class I SAM-dependent methyltransferase [Pyrodictium occultum]